MRIKFTIKNLNSVLKLFHIKKIKAQNVHPALRLIGNVVKKSIDQNFQEEGRPKWVPNHWITLEVFAHGRKQPPLNPNIPLWWQMDKLQTRVKRGENKGAFTVRAQKRITSKKVLQWTGRLRRSINFRIIGSNAVFAGTNVKYAKLHQEGGPLPKPWFGIENVEKRPFIMVHPHDRAEMRKLIKKYLLEN